MWIWLVTVAIALLPVILAGVGIHSMRRRRKPPMKWPKAIILGAVIFAVGWSLLFVCGVVFYAPMILPH